MEPKQRNLKYQPRTVYVDDDLWTALQSKVRGKKLTVSGWFRDNAKKFLEDKQ